MFDNYIVPVFLGGGALSLLGLLLFGWALPSFLKGKWSYLISLLGLGLVAFSYFDGAIVVTYKVWLGLGPSRNTPYVPFYGNVQDTYQAFKPQTATYDPNSWYWTVWHIDQMAIKNQDIFGKSVQDHWKLMEKQFIADQEKKDIENYSLKDQPDAAKAAEGKVTKDSLEMSDRLFQHFKDYEKMMEKRLEAAGRKSDPYRASQPDDKQDPSTPEKPDTPKPPQKPQTTDDANKTIIPAPDYTAAPPTHDIPANAEGNPNNRFGYTANSDNGKNFKNVETFVNTK